jgi:hypothetical protein
MPFFMLMLLAAIALVFTVAGFLLSNKSQVRQEQDDYSTSYPANRTLSRGRGSQMVMRQSRQAIVRQPARTIRTQQAIEFTDGPTIFDLWQSLSVNRVFKRRPGEPTPWLGLILVLLSVFLLFIFLMRLVMPDTMLIGALSWSPLQSTSTQPQQPAQTPSYAASKALIRIGQLDTAQYNSSGEYNLWAYSACSAAAFAEIINAYGHNYRVTDILKVESAIGEITPQLGLTEEVGVQRTMARFNFKTTWGHNLSLDGVINAANRGTPVIISWPPDRYAGGHVLVVRGGDSKNVFLADTSIYNRTVVSRSQFLSWWEGFYAISTPN